VDSRHTYVPRTQVRDSIVLDDSRVEDSGVPGIVTRLGRAQWSHWNVF